ncbi:MAG: site-specific integrase, partial [Deltaproteobacteria bacterium]|nr:site-specific integrase [Deltaproteobacteria bacterium]
RLRQTKSGKDHTIPLNRVARQVLENHPRISDYVFPSPRTGGQRAEFRKPVNRIRERAGLPKDFRPLHGLRHTFASMLASSGQVELYALSKLLTHATVQMSQRYAHLRDEALRRAAEVAGELLGQMAAGKNKVVNLKGENE